MEDLRQVRIAKLPDINTAFTSAQFTATRCSEFSDESGIANMVEDSEDYAVHGRVHSRRGGGKIMFVDVVDETGKVQVFLEVATLGEKVFANLKAALDIGDIVEAQGLVFITAAGEPTVKAEQFRILAKCILPPPIGKTFGEQHSGVLTDPEVQRRKRHLHLIAEPEAKQVFVTRSRIISAIRKHLELYGFMEVETPVLQDQRGGANARSFVTFHNAAEKEMHLRIAPELYLKRLLVAGFERVFEIGKNFRNEGSDSNHNPEFTMLECYAAFKDYEWTMRFVERMLQKLLNVALPKKRLWDFREPFKRVSYSAALDNVLPEGASVEQLFKLGEDEQIASARSAAEQINVSVGPEMLFAEIMDRVFKKAVVPSITDATFVVDYPVAISPLAKRKESDPNLTERYQLIVNGVELANGFSELNDPFDQRARFNLQAANAAKGDEEAMPLDEDFLEALEYAMPPSSGFGVGVDRLCQILTGATSIRDVILFPTMKND